MTITNQNLRVYRGDTRLLSVALTNADGTDFNPDADVVMNWRVTKSRYAADDDVFVRKTIGDGITKVEGGVEIILDSSDTIDLIPGLYYHELKVYDASDVYTAMIGNLVLRPSLRMGETITLEGGSFGVEGSAVE